MFSTYCFSFQAFDRAEVKIKRAIEVGNVKALNRVLSRNRELNVNLLNFDGWSPLHLAALSGQVLIAEYLIFGANANPLHKTLVCKKI